MFTLLSVLFWAVILGSIFCAIVVLTELKMKRGIVKFAVLISEFVLSAYLMILPICIIAFLIIYMKKHDISMKGLFEDGSVRRRV